MEFLSAVHTDKGIKKNTNQDSVLIKEAITDHGKVFFAAVCDGMGGLAKGEVASATLVRAFSDWFENRFPVFLYEKRTADGIDRIEMENDLNRLILDVNSRISAYGQQFHAALGTTAAMILFAEGRYYQPADKGSDICTERDRYGKDDSRGSQDASSEKCPAPVRRGERGHYPGI